VIKEDITMRPANKKSFYVSKLISQSSHRSLVRQETDIPRTRRNQGGTAESTTIPNLFTTKARSKEA
jgi:hypothetical protein